MEAGEQLAGSAMNAEEIAEVQARYSHLVNYVDQDPCVPIDPMSYIDSNGLPLRTTPMLAGVRTRWIFCSRMGQTLLSEIALADFLTSVVGTNKSWTGNRPLETEEDDVQNLL